MHHRLIDVPPSPTSPTSAKLPHIRGIELNGWTITTKKAPICSAHDLETLQEACGLPSVPDMLFGNNALAVAHENGACVNFCAQEALKCVLTDDLGHRVRMAQHWSDKSASLHQEIAEIRKPFDWTYSTSYTGSLIPSPTHLWQTSPGHLEIDIPMLKRPDPILFYDEVVLYEDELADNGIAQLVVKVRVMPTCFLILQRYFLRVDGVRFKVLDTRLFHAFSHGDYLIREFKTREAEYDFLKNKLPKLSDGSVDVTKLGDVNWVAERLPTISTQLETLDVVERDVQAANE